MLSSSVGVNSGESDRFSTKFNFLELKLVVSTMYPRTWRQRRLLLSESVTSRQPRVTRDIKCLKISKKKKIQADSGLNSEFEHFKMSTDEFVARSHVLHRAFAERPSKIVAGDGISLILENGKRVIDASCGPSVSCLGHSQPEIFEAITNHLRDDIAYVYSGSPYTNGATEELADLLLADKPGGLSKAIFVNSGSEATDAALKLAVQYWHERGQPKRTHFIGRKQSYHGNTIGALCVSGHESRREFYQDFLSPNVSFVDPCYAYRMKHKGESDEAFVERLAKQFEDEILRIGPHLVAGFIAETVSGTTLGCLPAVPGYFKAIRDICDKYDILLILDEVCTKKKTILKSGFELGFAFLTFSRLFVEWVKQVPCMHGNMKGFEVLIFKQLVKPLVAALYRYREFYYIRRSLMHFPLGLEVSLMATLFKYVIRAHNPFEKWSTDTD